MPKHQKYTPEFRAEAVELAISSEKNVVDVAVSLDIKEEILGNWVRSYRAEHPVTEAEEHGPVQWAQYEMLCRELSDVKRENEF